MLETIRKEIARAGDALVFHGYQRDAFGYARGDNEFANTHNILARVVRTDIVRLGHEQEMFRTGKTFWELHDIKEWAARAPKSARDPRWDKFWGELPSDAIAPLNELINQRRHAERARELEAQRRYKYDYSDADALRAIFANPPKSTGLDGKLRPTVSYGSYSAIDDLIGRAREVLFQAGPDTIPSNALVDAAYEAFATHPDGKPDVNEIIESAKRKAIDGRQTIKSVQNKLES